MRTIYISPEFPLNRRMRKAIRRGKLQVVREGEAGGRSEGNHAWTILDNPGEGHPDTDILQETDRMLTKARDLSADPGLNPHFARQLERYERALSNNAKLLRNTLHPVAFIGDVGVGKTSMICGLAGLQVRSKDSGKKPALITGPGGTTVCEVVINRGHRENRYALNVEPRGEEEIQAYVTDWCEYLTHIASPESSTQSESEKPSVPKEIDRAIRHMSGLAETRIPKTRERKDPAKDLAAHIGDSEKLRAEILKRMDLPRRQKTVDRGADMEWLRKSFADINDGKNPDFSIPERITVSIPSHPFGDEENRSGLGISIVDTKGVDETAMREDLQRHFDDPNAIVVLCSGFTNAPSVTAQQILERARDSGIRNIADKSSILVLPHGNEATAKQRDGDEMSAEEAYEEKEDAVRAAIFARGVGEVPIQFYNVENDDPEKIRDFFVSRIKGLRQRHREHLVERIETVRSLIENREKAEFLAQQATAAKRLADWISGRDMAEAGDKIQSELLAEMRAIRWASSLRASIAREGRWYNFDYYAILGYGARKIANARTRKWLDEFSITAEGAESDSTLSEARGFVREIRQWLIDTHSELLKRIEKECGVAFESALGSDNARHQLWSPAQAEWGRGPGYKNRVASHNQIWFDHDVAAQAAKHLDAQFLDGWRDILQQLHERLAVESPPSE